MKYCKKNSPYFLQDIPEFVLQSISPPNKGEWYAAVAIAKILDPNFQPVWSEEKEKGKMHKGKEKMLEKEEKELEGEEKELEGEEKELEGEEKELEGEEKELVGEEEKPEKTLKGVICEGNIVLSNLQMFAASELPAWLCSTDFRPDISVYPRPKDLNGENAKMIDYVQQNIIPSFLVECLSIDILQTARQLAIKLCVLDQLNRSHGFKIKKVRGIALPSMREESLEAGVQFLTIREDCTSQDRSNVSVKKHRQEKGQNVAIEVIVELNCDTLKLDVIYIPLKKEDVVKTIKSRIHERRDFNGLPTVSGPSHLFFRLTEEELDVLKCKIVQQLQLKRAKKIEKYLGSGKIVTSKIKEWKTEETTIKQCHSSISFVFKLMDNDEKTSLVLKSYSHQDAESTLTHIELRMSEAKLMHTLLSKYQLMVCSALFFVFEGLHQITREQAKGCLIEFLLFLKNAIDEFHNLDAAHLDIRLANICFKKEVDAPSPTAVLIDLERCKFGIHYSWSGESNSCMYKDGYSLQQIDYLQVYWMTFWILSYPADLDYHKMHLIKLKELESMQLEHGTLCKEIWSFINAFPIEGGWEKFMKVITSSGLETTSIPVPLL